MVLVSTSTNMLQWVVNLYVLEHFTHLSYCLILIIYEWEL